MQTPVRKILTRGRRAVGVLLVISAVDGLDRAIAAIGRRRDWHRPVAWLGPTLTVGAGLLFTAVLLPPQGAEGRAVAARYAALPGIVEAAGVALPRPGSDPDPGPPVISRFPIWLAEETGWRALALPNESPASAP